MRGREGMVLELERKHERERERERERKERDKEMGARRFLPAWNVPYVGHAWHSCRARGASAVGEQIG